MARRYTSNGTAAAGTNLAQLCLTSATTVRPGIYDVVWGVDAGAAPADLGIGLELIRTTAAGTAAGAGDDVALDEDGPAALASTGQGVFSVEPTKTATGILLTVPMNSRATFRWVAAPGSELQIQASATDGIAANCLAISSGTPNIACTMMWVE